MDTLTALPALRWLTLGVGVGLVMGYGLAWLTALFSGPGSDQA